MNNGMKNVHQKMHTKTRAQKDARPHFGVGRLLDWCRRSESNRYGVAPDRF